MKKNTLKTISLSAIITLSNPGFAKVNKNTNTQEKNPVNLNFEELVKNVNSNNLSEDEKSILTQLVK